MTNSTFDGSTIEFFYWTDASGGEVRFKTQSQKTWSSMTIGTTSFPSSTSWSFDPFDNYWSYSTSTNPFGANGSTTTITANY